MFCVQMTYGSNHEENHTLYKEYITWYAAAECFCGYRNYNWKSDGYNI